MPLRAVWRGAISFGMVVIPIKLFPATQSNSLSFVQLHSTCNTRIKQQKFCPHHESNVSNDEIVRAFEFAKDQYLVMDDEDFKDLPVPSTHSIEIVQFVDASEIDPVFFNSTYYTEPDGVGAKPYYLLKKALEDSGKVAIGKVALRQKEYLACLRTSDAGIVLETIYYPDEVRSTSELNIPDESMTTITKQEMELAHTLVDQLSGDFDPSAFRDEYRNALECRIEAKLTSTEPVKATPVSPKGQVGDLMAALRSSIESNKPAEKVAPPIKAQKKPAKKTRAKKATNAKAKV